MISARSKPGCRLAHRVPVHADLLDVELDDIAVLEEAADFEAAAKADRRS